MAQQWQQIFQCKLDQCFGKIKEVTVISGDIMIVGKKPNHSDHDQALAALPETARKCNVQLNYEKLQYKKQEVDFLMKKISSLPICKPFHIGNQPEALRSYFI